MTPHLFVHRPGAFTTVQDRGRFGHRALGVGPSGPLDRLALRLANAVVGNDDAAAGLELIGYGPEIEVRAERARLAIAGATARIEAQFDGSWRDVPAYRTLDLRYGDRLRLGPLPDASCAYLAVAGGIVTPPVLASRSTHVGARLGGLDGRALQNGDILPLRLAATESRDAMTLAPFADLYGRGPIRVVFGPQEDHFTQAARETLVRAEYTVSQNSDRMGLRLEGPSLSHRDGYEIPSDGLTFGSIQVPGSGQPIVMLAEHGTIGGYAKIATVVSCDCPRLARARVGDVLRFAAITVDEGETLYKAQAQALQETIARIRPCLPLGEVDPVMLAHADIAAAANAQALRALDTD